MFVPHLGTDQMFQFVFDEKSGRLTANTPPVLQLKQGTGPRHLIVSPDNRFVYLLNELTGTVTTLSLDANTGTLKELDSVSALPPDTKLGPGVPRGAVGAPGAGPAEHRQRHLGFGSSPHAERPLPLRRGAHVEHARRLPRRCRERKAHLYRKHADREAAPRLQHRPDRPVHCCVRREVGHDLVLRDRRRDRCAEADRTLPDRQGRELGRNHRLRLKGLPAILTHGSSACSPSPHRGPIGERSDRFSDPGEGAPYYR